MGCRSLDGKGQFWGAKRRNSVKQPIEMSFGGLTHAVSRNDVLVCAAWRIPLSRRCQHCCCSRRRCRCLDVDVVFIMMMVAVVVLFNNGKCTYSPDIGLSDVTVIYGDNTVSMLWGSTTYCVKLSGEDLSRYSNKSESVVFLNIRIMTILLRKWSNNSKHYAENALCHGGKELA